MSDFLDEVRADCLEAETDLGGRSMTWSGASYPVAPTLVHRGSVCVVGGREVEIKLTLRVRFSGTKAGGATWEFDPDNLPKSGEELIYASKKYRIAQVNNAHDTFLEIDLADINR